VSEVKEVEEAKKVIAKEVNAKGKCKKVNAKR
jgi:hypothetical protein